MDKKPWKEKITGGLVALLVLFIAVVGVAEVERTDDSGQWLYVLEDGGATITGYTAEELTGNLRIPGELDGYPVTCIGDGAFNRCESLTGAIIPEGVTRIGVEAFYWCESLTSVTVPDSVVSIGEWAFKECFDLTDVTLGSGLKSIGDTAFFGCESLPHVTIPDNVSSIGDYAFAHCYSLESVILPSSVTHIGECAFQYCEELLLALQEGSYAEQYANENDIPFTFEEIQTKPRALVDLYVPEDCDFGMVFGAAQSPEGMLLAGASEYWTDGWLTFIDGEGNEVWSLGEAGELYLRPISLANGGFAVLCKREGDEEISGENQSVSLLILNQEGIVMANPPVPLYATDIVAMADSILVLGNQEDEEKEPVTGESFLTCFSSEGEPLWTQSYTQPGCEELTFQKAVYAEKSLIVGASAYTAESYICLLYRLDQNGNLLWFAEATPEISDASSFIDICVNDDGIIALVCGEYAYDEDYGEPLDCLCDVFGLDMDGAVLWNHKMNGAMADYILPVRGGFLCASQGLGLFGCPYLGDGWVLLLDPDGNVKAADSTPNIGGGRYEVYGMAKGVSGEVFMYGTLLDEPGFPAAPFVGLLDFPQAYD